MLEVTKAGHVQVSEDRWTVHDFLPLEVIWNVSPLTWCRLDFGIDLPRSMFSIHRLWTWCGRPSKYIGMWYLGFRYDCVWFSIAKLSLVSCSGMATSVNICTSVNIVVSCLSGRYRWRSTLLKDSVMLLGPLDNENFVDMNGPITNARQAIKFYIHAICHTCFRM